MTKNAKIAGALLAAGTAALLATSLQARADMIITEVDPAGSGTNTTTGYKADWFELTNTGSTSQDITGWKMDDNSDSFGVAVPLVLSGNSIGAGQSVVFIEDDGNPFASDAQLEAAFESAWFGGTQSNPIVPAGFVMGTYGGTGVGLGQGGDGVNIFDSGGTQQAGVTFGTTPGTGGATLDNIAGLNFNGTSDPVISTFSAAGVNGAFASATSSEIGSPGNVSPAPEPATLSLITLGASGLLLRRCKRCGGQA